MTRKPFSKISLCTLFVFTFTPFAFGADSPELLSSPLAIAFGSPPDLQGVKISPDGSRFSFVQRSEDTTFAKIFNPALGQILPVMGAEKDEFDIAGCDWASNERLICALNVYESVVSERAGMIIPLGRLAAVNADGSELQVLLERQLVGRGFSQDQTGIVDWLPDDPDHILIETSRSGGSGIGLLDIHRGRATQHERNKQNVFNWISDGQGEARLYQSVTKNHMRWFERDSADDSWEEFSKVELSDLDATSNAFTPLGFGDNKDELLIFKYHEGKQSLFGMNLVSGSYEQRLIYSNPNVDLAGLLRLGKEQRVVAAAYVEEEIKFHFFDENIARIQAALNNAFPGSDVIIADEDWNRRYYLVHVGSDTDSGTYYRYDSQEQALALITKANTNLEGIELQPMEELSYPARDGVQIPAYLTLPEGTNKNLPTIILPHGGPEARDYADYNFLVQYLVAQGYAVLQSNYRGSAGYGKEWEGDGALRAWQLAVNDITDGTHYLVNEGISDPNRVCMVGWSYGGYAALMSVIEEQEIYQCVISIAGVSDLIKLRDDTVDNFVGGNAALARFGTDDDLLEQGSPALRAQDLNVPALLFHARQDVNVPLSQTDRLVKALEKNDKDFEFIEYDFAEHSIVPKRYRVDLLTRMGNFLQEQL